MEKILTTMRQIITSTGITRYIGRVQCTILASLYDVVSA